MRDIGTRTRHRLPAIRDEEIAHVVVDRRIVESGEQALHLLQHCRRCGLHGFSS
jgi:hypothetical protein